MQFLAAQTSFLSIVQSVSYATLVFLQRKDSLCIFRCTIHFVLHVMLFLYIENEIVSTCNCIKTRNESSRFFMQHLRNYLLKLLRFYEGLTLT